MVPREINKVSDFLWELPMSTKAGMRVPARIYASENLLSEMDDGVFEQVTNVATLPGIVKYSYCMPDGHWGYGFPIGGVAAFDLDEGVISPGGIGFDINCGMRLIRTNLEEGEVRPRIEKLVDELFRAIPAGVGCTGFVKLSQNEFQQVMAEGSAKVISMGYGWEEDLKRTEDHGCIKNADPSAVSKKAIDRGINQLGTLGSGNHYLEVQVVKEVFDQKCAEAFGLTEGRIVVMIHCGSRGLGHQVGTDYLDIFAKKIKDYGFKVPDMQLACAPINSPEGKRYHRAMASAANTAFANRQVIMHRVREVFEKVFGTSAKKLEMELVYDVAHNIAKVEEYEVDGKVRKLLVHRKGATRSFGANHRELDLGYREVGQPVIIGGSMETGSYLLVGTEKAMRESFGSTAHGSGRTMSRAQAKKQYRGTELQAKMRERGIYVRTVSMSGLAEEAGSAYKDISEVVETVHQAGISRKIASFVPIGNIKG